MLLASWHVVLRDTLVILAAASVIAMSAFVVLVVWQVYRLAIEMREEAQPIIESVESTAQTVQGTTEFVSSQTVPKAVTAVGFGASAVSVFSQLQQFYRGLRAPKATTTKIKEG